MLTPLTEEKSSDKGVRGVPRDPSVLPSHHKWTHCPPARRAGFFWTFFVSKPEPKSVPISGPLGSGTVEVVPISLNQKLNVLKWHHLFQKRIMIIIIYLNLRF